MCMCVLSLLQFNKIGLVQSVRKLIVPTVCHKCYPDELFFRKTGFNDSIVFFDITVFSLIKNLSCCFLSLLKPNGLSTAYGKEF